MDWTRPINIYCERLDASFWAEPINAISNLAFILAAIWAARIAHQRAEPNPLIWLLIALAAVIGIGSFLFHTFANAWSALADVLPIWTFVALYVLVGINRIGHVRPRNILIGLGLVIAAAAVYSALGGNGTEPQAAAAPAPDRFNGSLQYLPAVIAFLAFVVVMQWRGHKMRHWALAGLLIFMLSLFFRTIDPAVCGSFPLGTHFLWHLLNGLMIGIVLQILLRSPRPPRPSA
ncbi:MAG: ceramidase domain-containing protein [Paracoccus sp. (in: a-proteobacteria)]|nr:ceramidase domain-containing protein [Paracoccus sp. (in: a-proteobacteria)]